MTRAALALVMAALPISAALVLIDGAITPGYNNVSETISQLARPGMPYAPVLTAAFLVQAFATFGLAIALVRVRGGAKFAIPGAFLGAYGLATLAVALFQTESTANILWGLTANQIHQDSAHFGVFAVLASIATTGYVVRGETRWRTVARLSYLAIVVALIVGVTFPLNAWPGVHGIFERVLLGITVLWTEFVAVKLWMLQQRIPSPVAASPPAMKV